MLITPLLFLFHSFLSLQHPSSRHPPERPASSPARPLHAQHTCTIRSTASHLVGISLSSAALSPFPSASPSSSSRCYTLSSWTFLSPFLFLFLPQPLCTQAVAENTPSGCSLCAGGRRRKFLSPLPLFLSSSRSFVGTSVCHSPPPSRRRHAHFPSTDSSTARTTATSTPPASDAIHFLFLSTSLTVISSSPVATAREQHAHLHRSANRWLLPLTVPPSSAPSMGATTARRRLHRTD